MKSQDIIDALSLERHVEGGYFRETYRAEETIGTNRTGDQRNLLTSIYYLLTAEHPIGHFHMNKSDIVHYFHCGSPITYILLTPEGELSRYTLGNDPLSGQVMQIVVPGGVWKASHLETGEFGLIGEAVAPGFDYRDMTLAEAKDFKRQFPALWPELGKYVHSK